jgi:hypothetical protein
MGCLLLDHAEPHPQSEGLEEATFPVQLLEVVGSGTSPRTRAPRRRGGHIGAGGDWRQGAGAGPDRGFPRWRSEALAAPWALSSNADFAYPKTKVERPVGSKERAAYLKALGEIVNEDVDVHRLVAEVVGLAKPLSALMEEPLRGRVVGQMQRAA